MNINIPASIDFSKDEYKDFIEDISTNSYIFLGAGFSKQTGYKLWDELTKSIINRFWQLKLEGNLKNNDKLNWSIKKELESHNNKMYTMDYLFHLDQDKYYEVIKSIFNEDRKNLRIDIINVLKPLVRDNRYKFIQTNIDTSFQKECNIQTKDICAKPDFSEGSKLVYLHGKIDNEKSWTFTQEEYLINYQDDNSRLMKFLVDIFRKYTVLFIGYSLNDYEILQAIAKARINSSILKNHYILIGAYGSNYNELLINEDIYRNNFGIHAIKYNIEHGGYDLLQKNIDALVNILLPKLDKKK